MEAQVLFYRPDGGTVGRTARLSIARRNLKEAAGKAPAGRTRIAHAAAMPDEKAHIFTKSVTCTEGMDV